MIAFFKDATVVKTLTVVRQWPSVALRLVTDREVYLQDGEDYLRFTVTRRVQLAVAISALSLTALAGGTVGYMNWQNARINRTHDAVIADLQKRLTEMQATLDGTQASLKSLDDAARAQAADTHSVTADTVHLNAKIQQLQNDLRNAVKQNDALKAAYEKKLHDATEQLAATKAEAVAAATAAAKKVETKKLADAVAAKPAAKADDAPMDEISVKPSKANFRIGSLLRQLGMMVPDEGGPFVALGKDRPVKLTPAVTRLLRSLPLSVPINSVRVSSGFGARVDPINGRESFHPGIDLMGAYRTPVHNTGPGVVVHAGWEGAYGKMVEIDHGHGIHTRYGHLASVKVNVGQHLKNNQVIGLLGSTGRSTGPHVHYEIDVNGDPVDPTTFIDVGRSLVLVKDGAQD